MPGRLGEFLVRALCVVSVLLYAATLSLVAAPQITLDPSLVSDITVSAKFSDFRSDLLIERSVQRVNALKPLFNLTGKFIQPPKLIIDFENRKRFHVGATQVVLGSDIAKSQIHLERALIKSWILQNGSSATILNPLKIEVATDVLLGAYFGKLNLGTSNRPTQLRDWTTGVLGTFELCRSQWKPLELQGYCEGLAANKIFEVGATPYSTRAVLTTGLLNEVSALSANERLSVVREVARSIVRSTSVPPTLSHAPTLSELRVFIEQSAKDIYPSSKLLLPSEELETAFFAKRRAFLSSGFEIQKDSIQRVAIKNLVWASCAPVAIRELLESTAGSIDSILLINDCSDSKIDSTQLKNGILSFAVHHKNLDFAYVNRESLELAIKMVNDIDNLSITKLLNEPTRKHSKFLGLDQKTYSPELKVYQVNGPIGAIKWYRSQSAI